MKLTIVGRFDFLIEPRSLPFGQYQRTVTALPRTGWVWRTKFAYAWRPLAGTDLTRLRRLRRAQIGRSHDAFGRRGQRHGLDLQRHLQPAARARQRDHETAREELGAVGEQAGQQLGQEHEFPRVERLRLREQRPAVRAAELDLRERRLSDRPRDPEHAAADARLPRDPEPGRRARDRPRTCSTRPWERSAPTPSARRQARPGTTPLTRARAAPADELVPRPRPWPAGPGRPRGSPSCSTGSRPART